MKERAAEDEVFLRSKARLEAAANPPTRDEPSYQQGYEYGYAMGWAMAVELLTDMAPPIAKRLLAPDC